VADPTLDAVGAVFEDSLEQLRLAIGGAAPATLNRRPAGDETNPIAVLATHAMLSTRMWLGCALDADVPPRDRPEEFLVTADGPDELLGFVDEIAEECRALLGDAAPFDASALRVEPPTSRGEVSTEATTAGWALLHAVEHLGEHAGQAALTRQVLDQAL
jgi:DinB superfamily